MFAAPINPTSRHAIVAIPAKNEADRIAGCLAALSRQRDASGRPLSPDAFSVLVYANNCSDDTVAIAESVSLLSPHSVWVVSGQSPLEQDSAGWSRKQALDLAAKRLLDTGVLNGVLLTTDADTIVSQTWVSDTLSEIENGVDAVTGYVDVHPHEIVALGPTFLLRSRLENHFLRNAAELYAFCDPRPHDPFPNHRMSSGASLAVTLEAYNAVGGLPAVAVGEDRALTRALESAGFKVRHSMQVHVSTSCRFDGRAIGGAADTMRHRHLVADATCGDEIEPAFRLARRALLKGRARKAWMAQAGRDERPSFEDHWDWVTNAALADRIQLTPAQLPREIRRLEFILRNMRKATRASRGTEGVSVISADG